MDRSLNALRQRTNVITIGASVLAVAEMCAGLMESMWIADPQRLDLLFGQFDRLLFLFCHSWPGHNSPT